MKAAPKPPMIKSRPDQPLTHRMGKGVAVADQRLTPCCTTPQKFHQDTDVLSINEWQSAEPKCDNHRHKD